MEFRLEDLQTEEVHAVVAGGVTLGRDSRRSGIVIADPGVSGAHARIFERSGRFFIEDSNSSNGTFVEGTRLRGELELKDGFVIALHKYKFRVVLDGGSVGDSTALFEPKAGAPKPETKRPMGAAATRTQARSQEPEDAAIEDEEDDEPVPARQSRSPTAASRRDKRSSEKRSEIVRDPGVDDVDDDEDFADDVRDSARKPEKASAKNKSSSNDMAADLKGGFMKALAYYMAAVPKMALLPRSAADKLVEEQPFKAMEKLELAFWAAPPLALGAILSILASIVVGLVTHTFGIGSILSPIISGAITIVVGSIVCGWAWHPFYAWWIKLLKGQSDPQSRTNMMIGVMTSLTIVYAATGVGVLFTLLVRVPIVGPFVQIGPLALMAIASLISLYVNFVWYKYFKVTHWVPKIIVVFGVLTIANAAWGAIGFVRAGIASAGSLASSPSVPSIPDTAGLTDEQKKQIAAAQAAAQVAGGDAQANVAAAQAQAQAALQVAQAQAAAATQAAQARTETAKADVAKTRVAEPAAAAEPTAQTKAERVEAARNDAAAARADSAPTARAAPASHGKPTFAEFNQRSEAIEKMIAEDPSLLSRVPGALALYKKIHANDAKLKTKGKVDAVAERIHQAEVYSANVEAVEELYSKITAP